MAGKNADAIHLRETFFCVMYITSNKKHNQPSTRNYGGRYHMLAFNRLENRYIISGLIHFDSAIHIGSGLGSDRTDALFVCSRDRYYVPGSSLRGALRSLIERIATALVKSEHIGKVSCSLSASVDSRCLTSNHHSQEEVKEWRENMQAEEEILGRIEAANMLCRVCCLFGSPYIASKVKIADSFHEDNGTTLQSQIRIGIGIDRDTGSVRKGVLHDREVLESGPDFKMQIMVENIDEADPYDWGLLSLGLLEMMRTGGEGQFYLGARSASGLGKCHLKSSSIKINGFAGSDELVTFLDNGGYGQRFDHETVPSATDFLREKRRIFLDHRDSIFEETELGNPENSGE